ncbi:PTS galactitol transporter subunit IIB [Clostridium sp.]|jgi:PTS system galactitol-specific IIB component|uniref:PTS galactitol transporter subunit IIB n=1 Tax=Clostridium sp. TaxID=1506 RepID=UPI00344A794B
MKKVIVACGGAVATSTVAANAIKDLCEKNGVKIEIIQIRMSEIESRCDGVDLIVTTARMKKKFDGIPYVNGMAFLTGINREAVEEKILSYLK